jgi:hypothetical protein
MVIALAGIFCWLFVLATALSLGATAKRGDELDEKAGRFVADAETGAKIIPFERAPLRSAVSGADPVQQVVHDLIFESITHRPPHPCGAHPSLLPQHT